MTNKLEMVFVAALVDPQVKEALREAARRSDRSMSSLLRSALQEFLHSSLVMRDADELRLPKEMRQ